MNVMQNIGMKISVSKLAMSYHLTYKNCCECYKVSLISQLKN